MADYIYTYDKDELRQYLEKISKGIRVLMTPELEADLKMYAMELESEVMDNTDDIEEFKRNHSDLMKKKLEQKKREATKNDILLIELSDDIKNQLREEMSVSIVRDNPNLNYHKKDEELFSSKERREVFQKLSKLQKCYYNQADYVNAIKIIFEAIEYSLKHDYPWMSYEEALKEFNAGHIKFEYCQLPKLYLNWTTIIDDPETLKGIINGTVTIIQKDDDSTKKKKRAEPVPVRVEVDMTSTDEWNYWYNLHQKGYNTPITPVIKASQGTFSRFALPQTNMFYQQKEQEKRMPQEFDWMQEDAGEKYFNMIHGKTYSTNDLLDDLQTANNGNLTAKLQNNMDAFLNGLKYVNQPQQQQQQLYQSNLVKAPDQQVLAMEQSILQAMKNANPNK
jgi:hypothetical protein